MNADATRCPCRSGKQLRLCCGPVIAGDRQARTAEALMRSRYTAFALGDSEYLLHTWHPGHRPSALELDPIIDWRSLQIVDRTAGGLLDERGEVEFIARYRSPDGAGQLHERSTFVKLDGAWLYVNGVQP